MMSHSVAVQPFKEHVGAEADSLRRAPETPPDAGKSGEILGDIDGHQDIGVLGHALLSR